MPLARGRRPAHAEAEADGSTVNPISAPRGTQDILPPESARWSRLESDCREIAYRFGYGEIRTPIFEATELFARGVGETTDIVEKEMYTFVDKGDRSMTLRPELTAGVVRALLDQTGCGELGITSPDGKFTVIEVECLGACGFATPVMINEEVVESVTAARVPEILAGLK